MYVCAFGFGVGFILVGFEGYWMKGRKISVSLTLALLFFSVYIFKGFAGPQ